MKWIVIVGEQVVPDGAGGYKAGFSYIEDTAGNPSTLVGGHYRQVAGALLYHEHPGSRVVCLGGITPLHLAEAEKRDLNPKTCKASDFQTPFLDFVMAKALEAMNVPSNVIHCLSLIDREERLLGTTYQQLLALNALIMDTPASRRPNELVIVSNFWQTRVPAIALCATDLGIVNFISPARSGVRYESAEGLLWAFDKRRWSELDPAGLKADRRIQALAEIYAGRYRFGTIPGAAAQAK
ncbi:hypothetical protein HY933_02135 [Candidatus Falkowbacteria bacterium]|nr:hypothetical protein [Candidatus Falkowbacteria bacterium]